MNSTASKPSAYERYKLLLVPVLGLVLAAILFWPAKRQSDPLSAELGLQSQTSATSLDKISTTSWPATTLAEVTAFNPFDPPSRHTAPEQPGLEGAAEQQATEQDASVISPVQAVYEDRRGIVAIVNSQVVRVGDYLGGRRVLDISAKGLVLEPTH